MEDVCEKPWALGWTGGQGPDKNSGTEMGKSLEGKLRLLNIVSLVKISAFEENKKVTNKIIKPNNTNSDNYTKLILVKVSCADKKNKKQVRSLKMPQVTIQPC